MASGHLKDEYLETNFVIRDEPCPECDGDGRLSIPHGNDACWECNGSGRRCYKVGPRIIGLRVESFLREPNGPLRVATLVCISATEIAQQNTFFADLIKEGRYGPDEKRYAFRFDDGTLCDIGFGCTVYVLPGQSLVYV